MLVLFLNALNGVEKEVSSYILFMFRLEYSLWIYSRTERSHLLYTF